MWEQETSFRRYRGLAIGLVLVLCGVLAGAGWWIVQKRDSSPFSSELKATKLTLLYPTTLPEGYTMQPDTMSLTRDVITFKSANTKKQYINFSIQPRPEKFDFNTFYTSTLSDTFRFTTAKGEAIAGYMQSTNTSVGSLINGNTWFIVSAPQSIKSSEVQTILSNLKVY